MSLWLLSLPSSWLLLPQLVYLAINPSLVRRKPLAQSLVAMGLAERFLLANGRESGGGRSE